MMITIDRSRMIIISARSSLVPITRRPLQRIIRHLTISSLLKRRRVERIRRRGEIRRIVTIHNRSIISTLVVVVISLYKSFGHLTQPKQPPLLIDAHRRPLGHVLTRRRGSRCLLLL